MRIRKILLVDDDEDDRLLFADALREINPSLVCEEAYNGFEALRYLERVQPMPDVIFLDLNMPLMSGYDCLHKIKKNPRSLHIPVVIFTTSTIEAERQRTLQMGAYHFFSKPVNFSHLQDGIERILRSL